MRSELPKKQTVSDDEKEKKSRREEAIDDALEVAGVAADELSGLGLARRLYARLKQRVSREYIEEIRRLKIAHDELISMNNYLVRAGNDYVKRLDELEAEMELLRAEIRELKQCP